MIAIRPSISATWFSRLAIAAGISLATVCLFVALVGVAFFALDANRLPHYVSVVQSLSPGCDRLAVTLFWTMDQTGKAGWQHHLALHSLDSNSVSAVFAGPNIKPFSIAPGPDNVHVLVGTWNGEIHLLDLRQPEGESLCIGRQKGVVAALALSDDGKCIVSQSALGLRGWNFVERSERWQRNDLDSYCMVLRPDSQTVVVGTVDNRLLEIDLADGRTRRSLAHYDFPVVGATLSPDGGKLAVLRSDSTLLLLDSHTASPIWQRKLQRADHAAPGRMAAFSPCGTLLVTAGQAEGNTLSVWSVATGQQLCELRGHRKVVQGATFVSSQELRSWSADGTIRVWDVHSGTTQRVNQFSPPKAT